MLFHHRQYINTCRTCCHTFSSLTQDLELISTKLFLEPIALSVSAFVPGLEEVTTSVLGIEQALSLHLQNQKMEKRGNAKKHFQIMFLGCLFFVYYLSIFYTLTLLCIVKDLWRMYNVYTVHLHYDNKRKRKNRP